MNLTQVATNVINERTNRIAQIDLGFIPVELADLIKTQLRRDINPREVKSKFGNSKVAMSFSFDTFSDSFEVQVPKKFEKFIPEKFNKSGSDTLALGKKPEYDPRTSSRSNARSLEIYYDNLELAIQRDRARIFKIV